jgi:hypothetical protein
MKKETINISYVPFLNITFYSFTIRLLLLTACLSVKSFVMPFLDNLLGEKLSQNKNGKNEV